MNRKLMALYFVVALSLVGLGARSVASQSKAKRPLAAAATAHSTVLTWTQSPNPNCVPTACPVIGNNVYRGTTAGGEGTTPYFASTTPIVTFTDTAVTPGVTQFYVVTAVNANGESPKSNEVSATTPNQVVPNAPVQNPPTAQ